MMDWMSEYWWLSLIALLIGLATAYWIWCIDCPDDVRDRARLDTDVDRRVDTKVEPPKPLEPKKPEITAAKPMNFKDAPGFDTGKAATTAAAVGAAGLAATAVAKASEPVKTAPPKAPAPKPAEPIKAAAVKAAPAKKAATEKTTDKKATVAKPAAKAPAKTVAVKAAPVAKKPVVKTASKAAVAKKADPVKAAAVKKPATKAATKPGVKTTAVKAAPAKKAATPAKAPATKPVAKAPAKAAPKPKAEPAKKAPAKKAAAATGVMALGAVMNEAGKPKIRGAGAGKPDDLELIKGVGPKLNSLLISLGVTRFAQIASWTKAEIAEVDQYLGNFTGRIARDNWVDQAGYLAKGDHKGFAKKYGEVGSEIKK